MVGGTGGQGGAADRLTTDLRAAYDAAAAGWAGGPEQMYAPLARALVASAPVPLAGRQVLDLGAGTGVAGRAALAAGARRVVAADPAVGMLRRAGADLHSVAAFSLSHLASLPAGLGEARRVGRSLAASAFAPGWSHPAKAAVDEALRAAGYRPPAWYVRFKRDLEPAAGDPALLAGQAGAAGFRGVRLRTTTAATGLATPAQLASWRLGMAQVAPFVSSLGEADRAALRRAAERAVAGTGPLVVSMTILTAS